MNSEGPDQSAGPCSHIRVFTIHVRNILLRQNLLGNSEGPYQSAGPCSLIRVFTVHVRNI